MNTIKYTRRNRIIIICVVIMLISSFTLFTHTIAHERSISVQYGYSTATIFDEEEKTIHTVNGVFHTGISVSLSEKWWFSTSLMYDKMHSRLFSKYGKYPKQWTMDAELFETEIRFDYVFIPSFALYFPIKYSDQNYSRSLLSPGYPYYSYKYNFNCDSWSIGAGMGIRYDKAFYSNGSSRFGIILEVTMLYFRGKFDSVEQRIHHNNYTHTDAIMEHSEQEIRHTYHSKNAELGFFVNSSKTSATFVFSYFIQSYTTEKMRIANIEYQIPIIQLYYGPQLSIIWSF